MIYCLNSNRKSAKNKESGFSLLIGGCALEIELGQNDSLVEIVPPEIDQRGALGTENICIEHFEALGVISDPVTTKILPERKFPRSVSETVTQEKPEVSKSGVGSVLRSIPVFLTIRLISIHCFLCESAIEVVGST